MTTTLLISPAQCPISMGELGSSADFAVYPMDGYGWHWEGNSERCGEWCSEDGHESAKHAAADAVFELCRLALGYSDDQAIAEVLRQALPVERIAEAHGTPVLNPSEQVEQITYAMLAYTGGSAGEMETLDVIASVIGLA